LNIIVYTALRYFLPFKFEQSKGPGIFFKNVKKISGLTLRHTLQRKDKRIGEFSVAELQILKSEQVNLKTDKECRNSTKMFLHCKKLWQYEIFF